MAPFKKIDLSKQSYQINHVANARTASDTRARRMVLRTRTQTAVGKCVQWVQRVQCVQCAQYLHCYNVYNVYSVYNVYVYNDLTKQTLTPRATRARDAPCLRARIKITLFLRARDAWSLRTRTKTAVVGSGPHTNIDGQRSGMHAHTNVAQTLIRR